MHFPSQVEGSATTGTVVVESLSIAGMRAQKHIHGARRRRRDLADSSMSEIRRELTRKCVWYGSRLVEANLVYSSSSLSHVRSDRNEPGWNTSWTCVACGSRHYRDESAAINLGRYF